MEKKKNNNCVSSLEKSGYITRTSFKYKVETIILNYVMPILALGFLVVAFLYVIFFLIIVVKIVFNK